MKVYKFCKVQYTGQHILRVCIRVCTFYYNSITKFLTRIDFLTSISMCSNIFVYPTIINALLTGLIVHKLVQRVRTSRRLRIRNGITAAIGAGAVGAAVGQTFEASLGTAVGPTGQQTTFKQRKSYVKISTDPSIEHPSTETNNNTNNNNYNDNNNSRNDFQLKPIESSDEKMKMQPNGVSFQDLHIVELGSIDNVVIDNRVSTCALDGVNLIASATVIRNQTCSGSRGDELASSECNKAIVTEAKAVVSSCALFFERAVVQSPTLPSTPTPTSTSLSPSITFFQNQNIEPDLKALKTCTAQPSHSPSPTPNPVHKPSILRRASEYRASSDLGAQPRALVLTTVNSEFAASVAEACSTTTKHNQQRRRNGRGHKLENTTRANRNQNERRDSAGPAKNNGGFIDQSSTSNGENSSSAVSKEHREASTLDARGSRNNSWVGTISRSASLRRMSRASFKRASDPFVRIASHSHAEYSMTVTIVVLSVVQTGIFAGIGAVWPLVYLNNAFVFLTPKTMSRLLVSSIQLFRLLRD